MNTLKRTPSLWFKLTFILAASILAWLFGMIAVTANPIFVGLALGGVAGLFLLAIPKITIQIVIALGLATPALLDMAGHGLSRVLWAISLMAMLLWVPGLLNLFDLNRKKNKHIPLFVWIAIVFAFYTIFSTLSHLHSFGELFGGFKRYFQTFGLMLALVTMMYSKEDFDKWLKLLLGIALLQLPFALFERFILVPLRGGLAGGGQATDVVAGTMGANLDGGSPNAIMVTFVLLAFAFIFSRWKAGLISTSRTQVLSFILLLPLVLGETKVVVVMLPLMGLVLMRKDLMREPSKYIPIIAAMFMATVALAYFYVYFLLNTTISEAVADTISYNLQDVGYGSSFLNRTTTMSFWWKLHSWQDPVSFLFGHGLGSSYGSGYQAGHMAALYPGYSINLTTISTLLWDVGIVGLVLYILIFVVAYAQLSKVWQKTESRQVKADCLAVQSGIAITLLFLIYGDSQVNLLVHEIIVSILLAYAAFLMQQQWRESNAKLNVIKI